MSLVVLLFIDRGKDKKEVVAKKDVSVEGIELEKKAGVEKEGFFGLFKQVSGTC